ncbi:hypothetical protein N234_09500 [Ralstonia pickettii DTP0602]|nr:hypothetical protein N234_09500 [Ralstonia pickettii DTP0602]
MGASSFKWLVGGGERTPEERIREFSGLFTNARYVDAYGLTETCSGDTMMEAGRETDKIGSGQKKWQRLSCSWPPTGPRPSPG